MSKDKKSLIKRRALKRTSTGVTLFNSSKQKRPKKPKASQKKKSCKFCS